MPWAERCQPFGLQTESITAMGDGPIDAILTIIERITNVKVKLSDYHVRSISVGEDALGEAVI